MLNAIRLVTAAAVFSLAKVSWAAVVVGSFAGTAYDGYDSSGVFGVPGSDLGGAVITGMYTYDTDLLTSTVSGPVVTGIGVPGALTLTVTVGGQTFTFTDPSSSSVTLDASSGEIDLSLTNSVGDTYRSVTLSVVPATNMIVGTNLAQPFSSTSFNSSVGSFVIADDVNLASGDFTLSFMAQSVVPAGVPEPASLALLMTALVGAIAARGHWRRSEPDAC